MQFVKYSPFLIFVDSFSVFFNISLYSFSVIFGMTFSNSFNDLTVIPILFFVTNGANSDSLYTITGNSDDIYNDILCGLLYFI